jgi:molybdenum cofactor cytidylyltransferase
MATERDDAKVRSVAIILAAGASTRMGQSKQLLKVGNESLLHRTIQTAVNSTIERALVVLGSNEHQHREEIADISVPVIYNEDWKRGMGSSLRFGVRFIEQKFPSWETVVIMVCDQPLLTSNHLKKLVDTFRAEKKPIVASFYSGQPGVPVLFGRSMSEKLLGINDDAGAKSIIKNNPESSYFLDFPEGGIDLDTPEDWEGFKKSL